MWGLSINKEVTSLADALDLLIYLDESLTKNLNSLVIDGYIEKRTSKLKIEL